MMTTRSNAKKQLLEVNVIEAIDNTPAFIKDGCAPLNIDDPSFYLNR